MNTTTMRTGLRRTGIQATLLGLVSTALLAGYEWVVLQTAGNLYDGYRFQPWSSEEFMQEVHINDLLHEGPMGLWWLHVQPPLLETSRFLLSLPEYLTGRALTAQMIDQRMYGFYAVLYGVLIALVFLWIASLTKRKGWALAGAIGVALYSGTLAMATLLDGTFPSSVMATLMFFLLYLAIRDRSPRMLNWWLASLVALSLLRTIFQLQILVFVPLVVWALYQFRMQGKKVGAAVLSAVLVAALFLLPAKQYVLYKTTATTSFAGNHQIEVVSYRPTQAEMNAVQVPQDILNTASNFVSGFNSPENIRLNYTLSQIGNHYYMTHPAQVVKNLIWGFQMNTAQAFKFTHEYSSRDGIPANKLAASLPWTPPMVNGLSVTFYLGILALTFTLLLFAFGWRGLLRRLGTYWAFLFVLGCAMITFLLANRYDWSEADRLKFIVEPVFAVAFIGSLAFAQDAWRRRRDAASDGDITPIESAAS